MTEQASSNKKLAKNTMLLYFRMLFMMFIGLYTSRVILNALGVEDFGIYSVVGGVVSMFSIVSSSLSASISRFITVELGTGNMERLKKAFSMSVTIQFLLIAVVLVLFETVGLWFLNYQMVIPSERIVAANWVFQFSVVTFLLGLWSVPYNAAIIAHEKMSAFAYISIFDAIAKLIVAFAIVYSSIDRLSLYAFLLMLISLFDRLVYGLYCKRHFSECTYHFCFEKEYFKSMLSFSTWQFIGCTAGILRDQGGNMLLNLFFGPAVNAARGVAIQVSGFVRGFASNFLVALNPQIMKTYARDEIDRMITLVFQGARFSIYLLLLLSLPIILNTHYLLELWLGIVPSHAVLFCQLVLISSICEAMSNTLITAQDATGKIRNYQMVVGTALLMCFPLYYLFLKLGAAPESVFIVTIVMSQVCLALRLYMIRKIIPLSIVAYLKKVYFNALLVTVFSVAIPFLVNMQLEEGLVRFLLVSMLSVISTLLSIAYIGCSKQERNLFKQKVLPVIKQKLHLK